MPGDVEGEKLLSSLERGSTGSVSSVGTNESLNETIEAIPKMVPVQRAVVVEVLSNPSLRKNEDYIKLSDPVANEGMPKKAVSDNTDPENVFEGLINYDQMVNAPINSIVVRLLGRPPYTYGRESLNTFVCYPFFSSHISLPVKVGEQVWVFFEEPLNIENAKEVWWLSRVTGPRHVEDANYSHLDRRFDPTDKSQQGKLYDKEKLASPDKEEEVVEDGPSKDWTDDDLKPSFHNGPQVNSASPNTFTLRYEEEFEDYFDNSASKNDFVIEPVPRFTKRPGDLVLQGSHNSTIVLGTDRGWTSEERPTAIDGSSNAHREEALTEGLGAIDLVAGRGRLHIIDSAAADYEDEDPSVGTEPKVIKNTRESLELDKNPGINEEPTKDEPYTRINNQKFATEGDPDFVNDSSRIYLTMRSNPDDQFATIPDNIPTAFATEPEKKENTAAAVMKSDEIRIIARKTGLDSQSSAEPDMVDEINGSIRIIKEGVLDDDAAAIYLLSDGTIQVSGNTIYVGRTSDDGGKEAGSGEKGSEEWMRMSDFETWADGLIDAINTAFENVEKSLKSVGMKHMGLTNVVATGGFQVLIGPNLVFPSVGALAANDAMNHVHAPDKSAIEEYKSGKDAMEAIKSERVFGE